MKQRCRGHAQQETAERRRVGIAWQPGQILKRSVLLQQLCRFDPFQTEDHWVQEGQQHLADAGVIIPLRHKNMASNGVLKPKPRQE